MSKENNCPLIEGECIKGNQKDERIKQLEEALRSIAGNSCCKPCREAALVASKALGEDKE